MKKSILFILLSLLPLLASAKSVEIDGIWYNLIPEGNAAEVTRNPNVDKWSTWFSGICEIPASVTHGGVTYSVTSIGGSAFSNCSGLTSVTIPNSVTSIGGSTFSNCSGLTSVTIPNSVTSIGSHAFSYCSGLTSVTIPNSVTSIGESAFWGCSGLTSITIPNSVTSIGGSAFSGTVWYNNQPDGLVYAGKVAYKYKGTMPSNTSLSIKEGTLDIAGDAFSECSGLTSVTIPNSVTSIGSWAFYGCSGLTSVTIPNSVTSIGNGAFSGCNLESAHIHINDIASWCEDGISLRCRELHLYKNGEEIKDLVIPDGVTSIRSNAFKGCSGLTSITIPDNVTSIGGSAFNGCSGLTTLKIGKGVTSIGSYAFGDCTNLSDVYCYAEEFPSSYNEGIFNNTPINNAALYIPAIHQSKYQSTYPWSSFKYILLLEGATAERCAKPTISLKDGEIIFESETPDASFVSSYEALNSSTTEGNKMTLPNRFRITVFAQKYGLLDSPAATAEVEMSLGKFGDLTGDGQVNAADHVKLSEIIMGQ